MSTEYQRTDFDWDWDYVEPVDGCSAKFADLIIEVTDLKKTMKKEAKTHFGWSSSGQRVSNLTQHRYNEAVRELWHFAQENFSEK